MGDGSYGFRKPCSFLFAAGSQPCRADPHYRTVAEAVVWFWIECEQPAAKPSAVSGVRYFRPILCILHGVFAEKPVEVFVCQPVEAAGGSMVFTVSIIDFTARVIMVSSVARHLCVKRSKSFFWRPAPESRSYNVSYYCSHHFRSLLFTVFSQNGRKIFPYPGIRRDAR